MEDTRTAYAVGLMSSFAERTGLIGDTPVRRYLWTDAFAVCNFLGLRSATGDERYTKLALKLVEQVHHELGRHRPDDRRTGWISGLPDRDGDAHPTRGGLRIGKPLPERSATEAIDRDGEWDRDGQYFHYLTKWMHALDHASRATREPVFNVWARELAVAAHRAFTYGPPGDRRMFWKLSIDLSRPLVPSMGQHDPLDGLVTCAELEATAAELEIVPGPSLGRQTADFAQMLDRAALATIDPLGLGGLLIDACRLVQIGRGNGELVRSLLSAALAGLRAYVAQPDLRLPASARLGFRELGLTIGLAAVSFLESPRMALDAGNVSRVAELARYAPLRTEIEAFWLSPEHREARTWIEHADINDVMLATSLRPDGFLALGSAASLTPSAELGR